METKEILFELRAKKGLSQEALAERVMVTRQAVSRWENGDTVPNTETLKLLSREFEVSINTLLGEPRKLICQCCGMPLTDEIISRDREGFPNEEYCKWCYANGTYTYHNMDDLIRVCVQNMANTQCTPEQAQAYLQQLLPTLHYWKHLDELGDGGSFDCLKQTLLAEINALHIAGMPTLHSLNALVGAYVNLAYPLPSGIAAKFLHDETTYLGNQVQSEQETGRYFGVVANADFLLIATYEAEGKKPQLVLYKQR